VTPSGADLTPVLTGFSIKFELQGTARVQAEHLWNGEYQVRTYNNLNIVPNGLDFFQPDLHTWPAAATTRDQRGCLVDFGQSAKHRDLLGVYAQYQVDVTW
jgi:hypothetical protein